MRPTAKSYFTGAGLFNLGVMQAGIDVIQSIDLDKRAIKSMRMNPHYFGSAHRIRWEDMKDVTVLDQDRSDIHLYTWPCKKYSMIGEIHGVRTGDELYLHAFRHAALERPEMFVAENVPGMKYFKVVMEAMTKLPGYHVICLELNALTWVPQSRKRLIIIASKKPFSISEPVVRKRPRIKDTIEKNVEIEVNESVVSRINGEYRDKPIVVDPNDPDAFAPTCVAHYSKDMGTRLVVDRNYAYGLRPFTVREYARLQGVPDDYIFPEKNYAYELIGNGVQVDKARWIGEQVMRYFN